MTSSQDYLQARIDNSSIAGDFIINSIIKKFASKEYTNLLLRSEFSLLSIEEKKKINGQAAILWGEEVRAKELISEVEMDKFVKYLIDNKPSQFKSTKKKDWVKMVALLTLGYGPKTIKK